MTDATLTWTAPATTVARPAWLVAIAHRTEVLSRLARRNRYLVLTGRSTRRYPWFETMFASMSGR